MLRRKMFPSFLQRRMSGKYAVVDKKRIDKIEGIWFRRIGQFETNSLLEPVIDSYPSYCWSVGLVKFSKCPDVFLSLQQMKTCKSDAIRRYNVHVMRFSWDVNDSTHVVFWGEFLNFPHHQHSSTTSPVH